MELEKVAELLKLASEIEELVSRDPRRELFDVLYLLHPLRDGEEAQLLLGPEDVLTVGRWVKRRGVEECRGLLDLVKKYGDELKKLVREGVREAFGEVVDLAKELADYEMDVAVTFAPVKVKLLRLVDGGAEVREVSVYGASTQAKYPHSHYVVYLICEDGWRSVDLRRIAERSNDLLMVMAVADQLLGLYRLLRARVEEAARRNEEAFRRMRRAVAPYLVASTIGR